MKCSVVYIAVQCSSVLFSLQCSANQHGAMSDALQCSVDAATNDPLPAAWIQQVLHNAINELKLTQTNMVLFGYFVYISTFYFLLF